MRSTSAATVRAAAVAAGFAAALAASQSSAQTAAPASPTVTTAEATGLVSVVPGSPAPKDCLRSAKEICTYQVRGTETSNAYQGPGQFTEHITVDFTKPQSSAAGVWFPQLGIGTISTSQGDFNFYNQGQNCRLPQSAGAAPGFGSIMLNVVITGGTGRFQHAVGAFTVSVVAHPPAPALYHAIGAFAGVEPAR
jgi:hypothetical protein